jgi:hypothetical protein
MVIFAQRLEKLKLAIAARSRMRTRRTCMTVFQQVLWMFVNIPVLGKSRDCPIPRDSGPNMRLHWSCNTAGFPRDLELQDALKRSRLPGGSLAVEESAGSKNPLDDVRVAGASKLPFRL